MAASALPLQAQQESVSILRVMDGETLKIDRNGQKELIKLIGLDTPKSKMHSKAERDAIQSRQDFPAMTSMGTLKLCSSSNAPCHPQCQVSGKVFTGPCTSIRLYPKI